MAVNQLHFVSRNQWPMKLNKLDAQLTPMETPTYSQIASKTYFSTNK